MVNDFCVNVEVGQSSRDAPTAQYIKLLSWESLVLIYYSNFQRGLALQDLYDRHVSVLFRGTHQCAHEIFPFIDTHFDAFHVPLTYVDQAIPLPWSMPIFEMYDPSDVTSMFSNWKRDSTVTIPDFTDNWKLRRVYFLGNVKTIEKVTNYVRDIQE